MANSRERIKTSAAQCVDALKLSSSGMGEFERNTLAYAARRDWHRSPQVRDRCDSRLH